MNFIKSTFIIAAAMSAASAYAQVDRTFAFVDKDGKEIENGSTVIANQVNTIKEGDYSYEEIQSGVYVKNLTTDECGVGVTVTLNKLDNGAAQCCFPTQCLPNWGEVVGGTVKTGAGVMKADETKSLQTEWYPLKDGEAEATVKINVYYKVTKDKIGLPVYKELNVNGPSITIHFIKSANGISSVNTSTTAKAIAYYTADGKRISAPQKGLNIVKMSDGRTVKMVK